MNIKLLISKLTMALLILITTIVLLGSSGAYYVNKKLADVTITSETFAAAVNESRSAQIAFQRQVQEWKNILIRGNEQDLYDKYLKQFKEQESIMDNHLAKLSVLLDKQSISKAAVVELQLEHQKLGTTYMSALESTWQQSDNEAGKKVDLLLRGIDRKTSSQMDKLALDIQELSNNAISQMKADATALTIKLIIATILISILGLIWLKHVTKKAYFNIIKVLGLEPIELTKIFTKIANGDLTVQIPLVENDKTSTAVQIALMQRKIKNMIKAVKNGADELDVAAAKINNTTDPTEITTYVTESQHAARNLKQAASRFIIE